MDIKEIARKWALQNALKYDGKANMGAVIGKILSDHPELKAEMKAVSKDLQAVITEVNKLGVKKQEEELKKIAPELLEEKPKAEKKELKDLPGAVAGKFVARMAPSPSGPLHIGHAYGVLINSEYARKYHGKFILRLEDTNPENIYEPAYKQIPEDAKWLTKDNIGEIAIQSDRLGLYYDVVEKLIGQGNAYVCTCDQDTFRDLIVAKKACPCRELPIKEHQARWAKMFGEYKPGEAVVRIKTDVQHPNPAMRDWPAMRINDHTHPRQGTKHRVWPLMNLSVAVDDHLMGVTYVMNGKEHADNAKRQKYIFDYMGWKRPAYKNWGRINFIGLEISKTKTKQKIEYGEYDGWDDIRLPFLPALRRRGYQPDAFIKFAIDMGVTLNDKTVTGEEFFKSLNSNNREVIEPTSNRYFFVNDPAEITVDGAPEQKVELDMHPDYPKRGKRKFNCTDKFYLSKEDIAKLKDGKLYRLMDCLNFKKKGEKYTFVSNEYEDYKDKGEAIIHWLPVSKDLVNVEVLMEDKTTLKGLGESGMAKLKVGDIVQLERRFFARLDSKEGNLLKFWFTHR